MEPVLERSAASVRVVLSAQAALNALTAPKPPRLALLDMNLPGLPISQLLARARSHSGGRNYPIMLIADSLAHDSLTQEWLDRVAEGVIDDVIPRSAGSAYWQLRIERVLRAFRLAHEVEELREAATLSAQLDRLTGVYNREALMATLFRETDRVQRMNSAMTFLLFDIDDFGHWNTRLGSEACDELLRQVASRTTRLLRSYDVMGRPGMDEFLVALPGCGAANALLLAERLRKEVFGVPFVVGDEPIRLSACFGTACSKGRSPVVVLREAEEMLLGAKAAGPETIQCCDEELLPARTPVAYLAPATAGEWMAG
jgi:diguanylate cyclase (GGDEF)-like protein